MPIVKVQLPLFSSDGDDLALIYEQDRAHRIIRPLTDDEHAKMKGKKKAYFDAERAPLGDWVLGSVVEDQPW